MDAEAEYGVDLAETQAVKSCSPFPLDVAYRAYWTGDWTGWRMCVAVLEPVAASDK